MLRLCMTYWRTTTVIIVLVLCASPSTSHFMLWGLVPALLFVAGSLVAALAVIIGLSIRHRNAGKRARIASIRREINETRAMRLEAERARLFYGALKPGWTRDYVPGEVIGRDPGNE